MLNELLIPGIPVAEKLLRTLAVYLFLLIGLRIAGKRELGQFNPFDLVVLLLLSNTLQNAIIGNDNSLSGGLLGAMALLILNWLVVRGLYSHPVLARFFEGDSDVLIEKGAIHEDRLKRELITPAELEAAARRQGLEGLDHVEMCRLEIGGALTFVAKTPSDDLVRHRELLTLIEQLRSEQRALRDVVAGLRLPPAA